MSSDSSEEEFRPKSRQNYDNLPELFEVYGQDICGEVQSEDGATCSKKREASAVANMEAMMKMLKTNLRKLESCNFKEVHISNIKETIDEMQNVMEIQADIAMNAASMTIILSEMVSSMQKTIEILTQTVQTLRKENKKCKSEMKSIIDNQNQNKDDDDDDSPPRKIRLTPEGLAALKRFPLK